MRSFVKMKSSQNGEITLSFSDIVKSCQSQIFSIANMLFNAICKNKILTKFSGFTVYIKHTFKLGHVNLEYFHRPLRIKCNFEYQFGQAI